ncbi:biotin transporter BioY [Pararhizobium sp. YC-54]|uniref:biotin transporter BioY n=1 Tax=Pararhizobium sp. YC-54 TaxID=2986920 RepID=UPI0021F6A4BD|nr:biotin transporter BioY [Pararhizobium sp. YC-54]MCV9998957.1 biotin transporter BioY [Pararhizobium sp. YC-54]
MSGLETAIRHALERSERANSETRARIYQSARNALEAGLRKQDVHDPEVIAQQRHRLEAVIHAIELEERASLKAAASVPPPARAEAEDGRSPVPSAELDHDIHMPSERRDDMGSSPAVDGGLAGLRPERREGQRVAEAAPAEQVAGKRGKAAKTETAVAKTRRRKRGSFLSFVMVVTTLVAAFVMAAWWVETSGLLKSAAERDTSVANPPSTVQSEDFDGEAGLKTLGAQSGFSGDWVDVFTPTDASNVKAGSRAGVDPVSDERGPRLHITSATADAGGNVSIEIPASVLAQISGKTSTVALSVQADTGKQTQFSVECDFSSLGDCGRHRFTVNEEKSDMLFKVSFARSLAPSSPGYILINSDVTGSGNGLSVFAVRILPGQ